MITMIKYTDSYVCTLCIDQYSLHYTENLRFYVPHTHIQTHNTHKQGNTWTNKGSPQSQLHTHKYTDTVMYVILLTYRTLIYEAAPLIQLLKKRQ